MDAIAAGCRDRPAGAVRERIAVDHYENRHQASVLVNSTANEMSTADELLLIVNTRASPADAAFAALGVELPCDDVTLIAPLVMAVEFSLGVSVMVPDAVLAYSFVIVAAYGNRSIMRKS